MIDTRSKISGCLYGMTIGDGFGYPVEFMRISEIQFQYGPLGPQHPEGNPILVTDDTQMAIAVAEALVDCNGDYSYLKLSNHLHRHFLLWYASPDNNRAPGMTCLGACEKLAKGLPWQRATNRGSKGCGANMRVMPIGLLNVGWDEMSAIAQFQSAMTHAHPTALAASDITAATIRFLLEGVNASELMSRLYEYVTLRSRQYWSDFLKDIWQRPPFECVEDFLLFGWEDVKNSLDLVQEALAQNPVNIDACAITGEGWVAEEAFATALYCFLSSPNDAVNVLRKAVMSSGDSDSIACIAGAFAGAYNGIEAFPTDWVERIEYKTELEALAAFFSNQ